MNALLRVALLLKGVDNASGPVRKVAEAHAKLTDKVKGVEAASARMQAFNGIEPKAAQTASELSRLSGQMDRTASSADKLSAAERRLGDQTKRTSADLKFQSGWLQTIERVQGQNRTDRERRSAMREEGRKRLPSVGGAFRSASVGALGAYGAALSFNRLFVQPASQFENYLTVLKTIEGSSEKAQKSFAWVNKFAADTPYDLEGVTDAFVKLRSYGMDPMNGLLKTLGDTAAGMNKPLDMAVEAIADAVTGEYERLKEFGIKAASNGKKVAFTYTDQAGKQQKKTVDATNRAIIESTLSAIWNEKYAGAMDGLSQNWTGRVSNIGDQWTRFSNMVMRAGLFDWMKGKLGGILDKLNEMAANGQLQHFAELWSGKIQKGLQMCWDIATKLGPAIIGLLTVADRLANAVGGWDKLFYIWIGGKVIGGIVNTVTAFTMLVGIAPAVAGAMGTISAAMLPMLPVVLGITAGFAAIYKFADWYAQHQTDKINKAPGVELTDDARRRLNDPRQQEAIRRMRNLGSAWNPMEGINSLPAFQSWGNAAADTTPALLRRNSAEPMSGTLTIVIDQQGRARVGSMQTSQSLDLQVQTGPLLPYIGG